MKRLVLCIVLLLAACAADDEVCSDREYLGLGDECTVLEYMCGEGERPFSDECGCGCEPIPESAAPPENVAEPTNEMCFALSEEECLAVLQCAAEYGPSHCEGNICTPDSVFKRCVPNPTFAQNRDAEELCIATGGWWDRNQNKNFCVCPEQTPEEYIQLGYVRFVPELGCISEKALCDGTWKEPRPYVVENRRHFTPESCFTRNAYTIYDWHPATSICTITRYKNPEPLCV